MPQKIYFPKNFIGVIPKEIIQLIKVYLKSDLYNLRDYTNIFEPTSIDLYLYDDNGKEVVPFSTNYLDMVVNNTFEKTLVFNETSNNTTKNTIKIRLPYSSKDRKFLYKNPRFKNTDLNAIENIQFIVGGIVVHSITMDFYKDFQKRYNMSEIPLYIFKNGYISNKYHKGYFQIKSTKPVQLLIDMYSVHRPSQSLMHYPIFDSNPFTSSHIVKSKNNIIKLGRGRIHMFLCNYKLTNITLILNGQREFKLTQYGNEIPLVLKFGKFSDFVIDTDSISFHTMDLKFDSPFSNEIVLDQINTNYMFSTNGMSGLKYRYQ